MKIGLKNSLIFMGGASALGGLVYYFFPKGETVDTEKNPVEEITPLIPRNRINLKNFDWLSKADTLKNKNPKSNGLKAAVSWADNPQMATRWLELACHDPTERINDQEWNEFCQS